MLRIRNGSRRLVVELALLALLVGLPVEFPRHTSGPSAWAFLLRHPSEVAHAILGGLVLIETVLLLRRARIAGDAVCTALAAAGLLCAALAAGSGVAYVSSGQGDTALTSMTGGWIAAVIVDSVLWRRSSRALQGATGPRRRADRSR